MLDTALSKRPFGAIFCFMEFLVYALLSIIITYNINVLMPHYLTPRFPSKAGRFIAGAALFVLCLFPVIPHFLPSFFLFGILYGIYLIIFYKGRHNKVIALAMIFFSIMGSWSYLSSMILGPLILDSTVRPLEIAQLLLLVGLHILYFTAIRQFSASRKEQIQQLDLFTDNLWKAISLISLCPSLVIFLLVINPGPSRVFALVINFLAIGASSLMIPLLLQTGKSYRLAEENAQLKENAEYYEEIKLQQTQLRKFKHDLMNQFTVVATYLDLGENEKAKAYFKELGAQFSTITMNYTQDALVNAILNAKQQKAKGKGIKLDIYADLPEELHYNQTDLCTLIANSLDNAIEANPPDKLITMIFMQEEESLVFTCMNKYSGPILKQKDGSILTTKEDKISHGLGIRNIKEAVKRMGGTVTITTTDHVFSLTATLPLSESQ